MQPGTGCHLFVVTVKRDFICLNEYQTIYFKFIDSLLRFHFISVKSPYTLLPSPKPVKEQTKPKRVGISMLYSQIISIRFQKLLLLVILSLL